MDDTHELDMLAVDIDDARTRLDLFRNLLLEKLAPFGGTPELASHFIAGCDELGAAEVVRLLTADPAHYNLTALPPTLMRTVGPLIEQLADANYDFDTGIVAREHILSRQDATRERVYPFYGREAVLDRHHVRLRFLDSPHTDEPLEIISVPNRAAPAVTPDAIPAPPRRRRRDRDR